MALPLAGTYSPGAMPGEIHGLGPLLPPPRPWPAAAERFWVGTQPLNRAAQGAAHLGAERGRKQSLCRSQAYEALETGGPAALVGKRPQALSALALSQYWCFHSGAPYALGGPGRFVQP